MNNQCPADWRPSNFEALFFSMEGGCNPLSILLTDGTQRPATTDELKGYLDENPIWTDHVSPEVVRTLFPDGDGELFALFAELEWANREYHTAKSKGRDHAEFERMRDESKRAICAWQARSRAGAARQLRFLMDALWGMRGLTNEQQRQIVASAIAVLEAEYKKKRPGARYISKGTVLEPTGGAS